MIINTKYRQPIHYALIASIVLIQIVILLFFYNEYFNEKKLTAIENQIKEMRVLKSLTDDSRKELVHAQINLQKFITDQDKDFLEAYFTSLRNLSGNIDSINTYRNSEHSFQNSKDSLDAISKLKDFENLIEETYQTAQKPLPQPENLKIDKVVIKEQPSEVDVEVYYVTDSTT